MADTRAPVSDTVDDDAVTVDDLSTVVLALKSRRIGLLLPAARCILAYSSAWQLFLIACNLLLVLSSAAHIRPSLPLHDRHFYCLYFLTTLPLILWVSFSVAVLVQRRPDNLNTMTLLSISGLLLLLVDVFFLCRLLQMSLSALPEDTNFTGKLLEDDSGTHTHQ